MSGLNYHPPILVRTGFDRDLPARTMTADANPKSILIVDDDESFRTLVATLLESDGFDLRQAENGHQAIEELRRVPADVLITDIVMPDQDGLETIRKAHRMFPDLKIIAVSGVGRGEQYLDLALNFGARVTLEKSHVVEYLGRIVRGVVVP